MTNNLPAQAEIVIIGGGVIGCSVAYHLGKLGRRDVVVLERHKIGCGTTWHSAGNVTRFATSPTMMKLLAYGAELYAGIEAETEQAVGWRNCGRVMMAQTPERMEELKRMTALGRALGTEIEILSPGEAAVKLPIIRTDDLVGAAFSPGDGRVNPTDLTMAYAKGARAHGIRFVEETRVTGVRVEGGAVRAVDTDAGEIACETVVNCGGLWAKQIGEMCGVTVPLHANEHFYMLTKPIDGVSPDMPTFRDPDSLTYGREDVGGLLVGCFDTDAKALPLERLPEDFAFALLNEDWDQFEPYMKSAIERIPALESVEVHTLLNGPESFTPDGNMLMGAAPELRGYYVLAAMNSGGVTLSGGAGHALADWIVEGHPTIDVTELDIRRFSPIHGNDAWLRERSREMTSFHFMVAGPDHDFETGRMLRRSVLHDRLAERGARFGSIMGWERPNWFDTGEDGDDSFPYVQAEHRAARQGVAVFDLSSSTKILVQGRDAGRHLQTLSAADTAVPPGTAIVAPFLNERGGVESFPILLRLQDDAWLILSEPGQSTRDLDWIRRQNSEHDQTYAFDVTPAWTILGLIGPEVPALLERTGAAASTVRQMTPGSLRQLEIGYATGWMLCSPLTDAWQLLVPTEYAVGAYQSILDSGCEFGLRDAGHHALESLRLQAAVPQWGRELSAQVSAFEGGLRRYLDLSENTDFIGREALLRQEEQGLTASVRAFTVADARARPLGGEPILRNGAPAGLVSSTAYDHDIGRALVMGYLDGGTAEGRFELDMAGSVVQLAPYEPTSLEAGR